MVGVIVGFDDCFYLQAFGGSKFQDVVYHVEARIYDCACTCAGTSDDITCASQVFFDELFEVQRWTSCLWQIVYQ